MEVTVNTMKVRLLTLAQFSSSILHTCYGWSLRTGCSGYGFLEKTKEQKKLSY